MSASGSGTRAQKKNIKAKFLALWISCIALAIFLFFYSFYPILAPFLFSFAVAYALHPIVTLLEKKGFNRTTATALLVLLSVFFIVMIFLVSVPFLKNELSSLALNFPGYFNYIVHTLVPKIERWITLYPGTLPSEFKHDIQATITQNFSKMIAWTFQFLANLFSNALAIANLASLLLLTPLLIFYLLRDWPKMLTFFDALIPPKMQAETQNLGRRINAVLAGYFRGQASVCLIMVCYYIIAFKIVGLHYAFTIGFLSGLLIFIPYVGFFVSFTAALGIAVVQFDSGVKIISIICIYLIAQGIESFMLTPKLVGDRVGLHPVWVIFSLFAGGYALGFLGLLIAVPLSATLAVLLRFVINKYQMLILHQ